VTLLLTGPGLGCALHEVDPTPAPRVAAPESFSSHSEPASRELVEAWWRDFGDAELNAIIAQALGGNFDLAAARDRLAQAIFFGDAATASLYPELSLNGQAQRSRSTQQFGFGGQQTLLNSRFSLTGALAVPVDLWGGLRAQRRAVLEELEASASDFADTARVVAGSVAEVWLQLAEQRAQLALLEAQQLTNKRILKLQENRIRNQGGAAVEILQQRQQVAANLSERPRLRVRIRLLEHQLNILLGIAPAAPSPSARAGLPVLPSRFRLPAPASLLERRPDLRAARARLKAADERITTAIAERLPGFRIDANAGLQSVEVSSFLTSLAANITAGLVAPIFDAGRREAEVERQRAVTSELLQRYSQLFLNALGEVEDALVQEREHRRLLEALAAQLALARDTLENARERYGSGLGDYLTVLTSLRGLESLERTQLTARRELLVFRVQLYRALGGSWTTAMKTEARAAIDGS
jgi:outer membrane protein, multidrug efflux system